MPNIFGTSGSDTITPGFTSAGVTGGYPGDGDDSIRGLDGDDSIIGGGGDDTIVADLSGGGFDRVSYAGASGGVTVNLGTGRSSGAAGNDSLINVDEVYGSSHDDLLLTGNRTDLSLLAGEDGNDTISAEGRPSGGILYYLRGGTGNDSLFGGNGGNFPEILEGGDGDDTLVSQNGGLQGGEGHDSLVGGGDGYIGNDTIVSLARDYQQANGGNGEDQGNRLRLVGIPDCGVM
ncbi:MAG: hypothetical protein INF90_18195 [Roseomonas sp.]|nr:hypothetical protein [Roseomonas sp.]